MNDELSAAILDYVASQYGGAWPSNVTGWITGVAVTQEYSGTSRLELSMMLAESDAPKRKPKKDESPWIKAKSRLPDVDEPVLVCVKDSVSVGCCDASGVFCKTDSLATFKPQPTHWMPLPAGVA
jgi:hypothetical protein